jgi:hypothetical protein
MLKKVLILAGLFILLCACVITSPAEIFFPTPTICVECVQATICAENVSGEPCVIKTPSTPVDILPTLTSATDEVTATHVVTEALEATATATKKIIVTLPSKTSQPTIELPTQTPTPEKTGIPTRTQANVNPAPNTQTATPNAKPETWIYESQAGSPKYTKNFAHPESACKWSGIAGQVFGPNGAPQSDVVVVVSGDSNGTPVDLLGFTGASVAYGEGAFEMEFPKGPVRTYDSIQIQLFDLAGNQLSKAYSFDTYADCTKNLVVFNFGLKK